jgi:hypothetical protein
MNRRILVLTIALLFTVVPVVAAKASDTPTIAPTLLTSPVLEAGPELVLSKVEGQSQGVEGRVTAYGLNVRTGPGPAYPIVGGLSRGDVVEVVGKNATSDWLQIIHPAGVEGQAWIAAAYVDLSGSLAVVPEVSAPPTPPPTPTPMPTPTPEPRGKLVFQTCNGCGIYVINADGSDQRPMFETALDSLNIEYGFVSERMVSWTKRVKGAKYRKALAAWPGLSFFLQHPFTTSP